MKILLLEKDDTDALFFFNSLEQIIDEKLEYARFASLDDCWDQVGFFDVIVLDLFLTDVQGLALVKKLCDAFPRMPVIVWSKSVSSEELAKIISVGVHDYLVKGVAPPDTILRCIRSAIVRKKVEIQLVSTSENKSAFLSRMSHEIRTPLNVILGFLDVLLEESPRDDQRELLRTASRAGESLRVIVNDILDLSKVEAGKLKLDIGRFDIRHVLGSCYNLLQASAQSKDLDFKLSIDQSFPRYVQGDAHRVQQILVNLLNNAIKFTAKGSVELSASSVVDVQTQKTFLLLKVSDTGRGISESQRQHLFTPYEQCRTDDALMAGGTGLGLSISKQLAELMGGTIAVDSIENSGTSFLVTLPLPICKKIIDENLTDHIVEKDILLLKNKKILVVEDDPDNQRLLQVYFKKLPLQYEFASDGDQAIEKLSAQVWDAVLLDNQIPGPSGIEVVNWLRHYERNNGLTRTPLIAISGDATSNSPFNNYKSEFTKFLPKPFKKNVLIKCILESLSSA